MGAAGIGREERSEKSFAGLQENLEGDLRLFLNMPLNQMILWWISGESDD